MINIAIIGVGQIGSRHLQALAHFQKNINIQLVDVNEESLVTARKKYEECKVNSPTSKISFYNKLSDLDHDTDLAIIATNSDVRSKVIHQLLTNTKTKYLILEKVLFPSIQQYFDISELLTKNNVLAWVNCTRRMWPIYKEIKMQIQNSNIFEVNVSGSLWNLGSNAIHIIDLVSYLIDTCEYRIISSNLNDKILPSKRSGFIEFTGSLYGVSGNETFFSITSFSQGDLPFVIQIFAENFRFIVRESESKLFVSSKNDNWVWEEKDFQTYYQSQLTHIAVNEILEYEKCDLTPFEESKSLHLPLIKKFIEHIQKNSKKEIVNCTVT